MAILYVQKVFHFQNFLAYYSCNRRQVPGEAGR